MLSARMKDTLITKTSKILTKTDITMIIYIHWFYALSNGGCFVKLGFLSGS